MKRQFAVTAIAVSVATAVFAHGGATGVVKERMDAMSAMGKWVKELAPMMRGERAYDAERVRSAGQAFEDHSGQALTDLFPEGTTTPPSDARIEIWQNWDAFSVLANELETLGKGLAQAAPNGLRSSSGGMGAASMMGMGTQDTMMDGTAMMSGTPAVERMDFPSMPADVVFEMTSRTCAACHARFRKED